MLHNLEACERPSPTPLLRYAAPLSAPHIPAPLPPSRTRPKKTESRELIYALNVLVGWAILEDDLKAH